MWDRRGIACWRRMTSITRIRRPASRFQYCVSQSGRRHVAMAVLRRPVASSRKTHHFHSAVRFYRRAAVSICPTAIVLWLANSRFSGSPWSASSVLVAAVRSLDRERCPISGVPVFTSIFAQDTIAGSGYNSLQVSLDKRFARGLQFTAAYTFSKSIDEASSFEGILNPLPGAHNYSLSLFDARHRFVVSYY